MAQNSNTLLLDQINESIEDLKDKIKLHEDQPVIDHALLNYWKGKLSALVDVALMISIYDPKKLTGS